MAFIDVVSWEPNTNDIYAFKFPNDNLSTATQLLVRENQEAVLFSKGQIIGKFAPGKHTLTTQNLPLLRNLYGIPFGGKNPFMAQVWFVNKAAPLTIDWKSTAMRFMDPDYNQMIPLVAQGRYGLKVAQAERFLIKLVGSVQVFDTRSLTDHFMGALVAKTNSSILSYMTTNKIGINQIAAYLDPLSQFIKQPLAEFWEDYGIALEGFYITNIDLDTTTEDGKKIAQALSDRSAQGIAGFSWQQRQSFKVADNALSKGGNMGILGAAMMTGMLGGGGGGIGASIMQPTTLTGSAMVGGNSGFVGGSNPNMGGASMQQRQEVFCSNCGKKFPMTARFCPYCGDPYNPCPVCKSDNPTGAKRCVTCGAALQDSNASMTNINLVCSRCGAALTPGIKFCPSCGQKNS